MRTPIFIKVETILKDSLDSIPSLSPSVKIKIICRNVCLKCKGKTLLGDVHKLFVFKNFVYNVQHCFAFTLKQTFPHRIWIFIEGEGDGIKSRLPFKFFSTLKFLGEGGLVEKQWFIIHNIQQILNFLFLSLCVYFVKNCPSQFLSHWG